jgi:hypothetical protein
VDPVVQAVANFVSGQILGVLLAMAFRFWAFRRYVFPDDLREAELHSIQG